MAYTIVIPARYGSSRFLGKPLADIAGKPMIQHVYERCQQSGASRIVVATDDERIVECVEGFGGTVCLTSTSHESGTERISEVIEILGLDEDEIIVNVQGDEPLIPPQVIDQVADNLRSRPAVNMATLAVKITQDEEKSSSNVVKVVSDKDGYALYFSRSLIPFQREQDINFDYSYLRHIGLYSYRAKFVKQYLTWQASPLEHIECLEQLRVLWHGEKLHVDIASQQPPPGVDSPEDLKLVQEMLSKK